MAAAALLGVAWSLKWITRVARARRFGFGAESPPEKLGKKLGGPPGQCVGAGSSAAALPCRAVRMLQSDIRVRRKRNNGGLPHALRHWVRQNLPPSTPGGICPDDTVFVASKLKLKYPEQADLKGIHLCINELRRWATANDRPDILEAVPPYTEDRHEHGYERWKAFHALLSQQIKEDRGDNSDVPGQGWIPYKGPADQTPIDGTVIDGLNNLRNHHAADGRLQRPPSPPSVRDIEHLLSLRAAAAALAAQTAPAATSARNRPLELGCDEAVEALPSGYFGRTSTAPRPRLARPAIGAKPDCSPAAGFSSALPIRTTTPVHAHMERLPALMTDDATVFGRLCMPLSATDW